MKGLKYVNMFNRGVSRVQNMLEENGNPKAEFDVTKLTAFEVKVLSTVTETKLVDQATNQATNQATDQATDQVLNVLDAGSAVKILALLQAEPRSKREILTEVLKKTSHFYNYMKYIAPLLEQGLIEPTIKDKPSSPNQKYKITDLGLAYFEYIKKH